MNLLIFIRAIYLGHCFGVLSKSVGLNARSVLYMLISQMSGNESRLQQFIKTLSN